MSGSNRRFQKWEEWTKLGLQQAETCGGSSQLAQPLEMQIPVLKIKDCLKKKKVRLIWLRRYPVILIKPHFNDWNLMQSRGTQIKFPVKAYISLKQGNQHFRKKYWLLFQDFLEGLSQGMSSKGEFLEEHSREMTHRWGREFIHRGKSRCPQGKPLC